MLDYKVESVPEGLEDHYVEQDGSFVLDITGMVADTTELDNTKTELATQKTKVADFRKTNESLMKQIKNSGGNVDENYQVNIDDAINEALAPIRESNVSLKDENSKLHATLEEVVLSDKVKDIAMKHGVFESALSDVVSRAKNVFTVKEGKPVPKDKKNSRDADGNVLSTETWLQSLSDSAPHLFKPSNGSGAVRPINGHIQPDRSSAQKIADGLNKL